MVWYGLFRSLTRNEHVCLPETLDLDLLQSYSILSVQYAIVDI
mgnify:FL=1